MIGQSSTQHQSPQAGEGSLVIETDGLTKRYSDVLAVDDLHLAIPGSTVYGFLGPNGSGKTTTMRMLTTLTRPSEGAARIVGVDIGDRDALIDHIGYLPEEPPLFDELTGREQLRHVAALHDIAADEADRRITEYLRRFDLEDAADRRQKGYSTGMRKKVGLIQTVIHEPAVLFLDEPTSGLDPGARRSLHDLLRRLRGAGRTILLTTHYTGEAEELCDRVLVLRDGSLVADGSPLELVRRSGGETRLWVDVGGEMDAAPLLDAGVREDGREGPYRCFTTRRPARAIETLGNLLRDQGLQLEDLRVKRPSLEDVYLELVDRADRQGAQERDRGSSRAAVGAGRATS